MKQMNYYLSRKIGDEPEFLEWDGQIIEFSTAQDAEDFLASCKYTLGDDWFADTEVVNMIVFDDRGFINCDDKKFTIDDVTCEEILLPKE